MISQLFAAFIQALRETQEKCLAKRRIYALWPIFALQGAKMAL
jgi:hypothetical protein